MTLWLRNEVMTKWVRRHQHNDEPPYDDVMMTKWLDQLGSRGITSMRMYRSDDDDAEVIELYSWMW